MNHTMKKERRLFGVMEHMNLLLLPNCPEHQAVVRASLSQRLGNIPWRFYKRLVIQEQKFNS